MPETNYYTVGCNTPRKHTRISIFKIPFHSWNYVLNSIMQSDTTVVSRSAAFFLKKAAIIIATYGEKTLPWQLSKVILSGI